MRSKYSEFDFPARIEVNGPYSRRYYGGDDAPANTTTTNQLYSPEETARRAKLMDEAQRIYQRQSSELPGLKPAGPSSGTMEGMKQIQALAAPGGQLQQMQGDYAKALNFGTTKATDPANDPGFQKVLQGALSDVDKKYTDPGGVMSQIRGNFMTGNSGGASTREGVAGGIAGREYLNTIGDVTGKMYSDAYGKGLDVMTKSMALTPTGMQAAMMPGQVTAGVGETGEAYAERQRQWEAQSPWMAFQPYANAVHGGSSPGTQTTAPGAQAPGVSPMQGAIAGAAMGTAISPGWGTAIGAGAGLLLSMLA